MSGTEARSGPRERPRVSVVVPVRDRRELLRALLEALDAQTYRDFEVIVVDDGSIDGSGECADGAVMTGRRVRVLWQHGIGAVRARELGVSAARGDILAFTDSDCMPSPSWIASGVAAIDDGAAVVYGETRSARPVRPRERSVTAGDDGLFATCNVFYRRDAFEAGGGFDHPDAWRLGYRVSARARGLGFGEDSLLGWRVKRAGGEVRYVQQAVVLHHVFPPDLSERLNRALMAAAFPALLAEVPELRAKLVRYRVMFGTRTRLPMYATLLALALNRRSAALLAASWWSFSRVRDVRATRAPFVEQIRSLPEEMLVDLATGSALIVGSVRARLLLL